jgi:hypothetical protein
MDAPVQTRRRWPLVLAAFLLLVGAGTIYVLCNPLIFNESFFQHAHCIKQAGMGFVNYAVLNGGQFPTHPRGYGDALLLIDEELYDALTGPGYDSTALHVAKQRGTPLAEQDCGRVYIQGLNASAGSKVAILFDKQSTPGGDHCHMIARFSAPLGREVAFADGHNEFIPDSDWPAFVQNQLPLLTAAGIPLKEAQRLYDSVVTP